MARRIVHPTNELLFNGTGLTNSTIDLAVEQAVRGDQVAFLCFGVSDEVRTFLARHNIQICLLPRKGHLAKVLSQSVRARRLLRQSHVVHLHTTKSAAVSLLLAPVTFWRRSVATIHNPHQSATRLLYVARRIVALSGPQALDIRRRTAYLRKPFAINNGILGSRRIAAASTLEPISLPENSIVFVGAIHERKGVDVLLTATRRIVDRIPSAKLFIIGNRDNPFLEKLALDLGLSDAVTFVGFRDDPRDFMKASRVFVLPSREEGFGNVITEARSVGSAIVASQVGGIPEALSGGQAGLLVEPASPELLADAIIQCLTDDDLNSKLRVAVKRGLDNFHISRAASEYDAVYDTLSPKSTVVEKLSAVLFGRRP